MARMNKTVKFDKGVNALVWEEEGLFVAKALEVEVASQGVSERQALENLKEALELYFEDEKVDLSNVGYKDSVSLRKVYPEFNYA